MTIGEVGGSGSRDPSRKPDKTKKKDKSKEEKDNEKRKSDLSRTCSLQPKRMGINFANFDTTKR